MKKIFCLFAFCLLLCGCAKSAVGTNATDNSEVKVERLFTDSNGYTVMRFNDGGQYHYYVVPGPARIETNIRQGKVVRQETIDTK